MHLRDEKAYPHLREENVQPRHSRTWRWKTQHSGRGRICTKERKFWAREVGFKFGHTREKALVQRLHLMGNHTIERDRGEVDWEILRDGGEEGQSIFLWKSIQVLKEDQSVFLWGSIQVIERSLWKEDLEACFLKGGSVHDSVDLESMI